MPTVLPASNGAVTRRLTFWGRAASVLALYVLSRVALTTVLAITARIRHQSLLAYLHGWDGNWYLQIAASGYVHHLPVGHGNAAQVNVGFFPLLPLVTRGVHLLIGGRWALAALAANAVAGAIAVILLEDWLAHRYSDQAARRGVLLVLVSPASVVLSMVYSETLIVLAATATLWALDRQQWWLAGLAAAFATTVDPVGLAACVPCMVVAIDAIRVRRQWSALVAPALAPLGIGAFFFYLWRHTGSWMAYFIAQRAGWQQGPLGTGIGYDFFEFAAHFFRDVNPAMKTLGLFAAIAMAWWVRRVRIDRASSSYIAGVFFLAALSPITGISPRILLRAFPLLAHTGATVPRRAFAIIVLASFGVAVLLAVWSTSLVWTP